MGSGFGLYVLSIVGAVVLMTVADIIMPDGETAKYIKSTLSIFLVLIIITPIANFLSGSTDLSGFLINEKVQTDYSFINKLNEKKADALEEKTENYLKQKGYTNVGVNILYTGSTEGIEIDYVHLDLINLVFNSNDEHINIIDNIVEYVSVYLNVTKENIYTYGAD